MDPFALKPLRCTSPLQPEQLRARVEASTCARRPAFGSLFEKRPWCGRWLPGEVGRFEVTHVDGGPPVRAEVRPALQGAEVTVRLMPWMLIGPGLVALGPMVWLLALLWHSPLQGLLVLAWWAFCWYVAFGWPYQRRLRRTRKALRELLGAELEPGP